MREVELFELKDYIQSCINRKNSKDFRFWGGIIVLLLVVIFWSALINMNHHIEEANLKIDPQSYSWDHVYEIFKEKYNYEKSLFADVESENIVLKSMIDDIYYLYHKDELFLTYFQKAEIIRRDLERRGSCEENRP